VHLNYIGLLGAAACHEIIHHKCHEGVLVKGRLADQEGFRAVTKLLLAARCNVDLQAKDGATALQVAERYGHTGIATLIRNKKYIRVDRGKKDTLVQASPAQTKKQQEDADRAMKELLEEEDKDAAAAAAVISEEAPASAKSKSRAAPAAAGAGPRYTYQSLSIATNNFEKRLGGGGCGSVFQGVLASATRVVLKRLELGVAAGAGVAGLSMIDQMRTEVKVLSQVQKCTKVLSPTPEELLMCN
jgi:hypothetical protein